MTPQRPLIRVFDNSRTIHVFSVRFRPEIRYDDSCHCFRGNSLAPASGVAANKRTAVASFDHLSGSCASPFATALKVCFRRVNAAWRNRLRFAACLAGAVSADVSEVAYHSARDTSAFGCWRGARSVDSKTANGFQTLRMDAQEPNTFVQSRSPQSLRTTLRVFACAQVGGETIALIVTAAGTLQKKSHASARAICDAWPDGGGKRQAPHAALPSYNQRTRASIRIQTHARRDLGHAPTEGSSPRASRSATLASRPVSPLAPGVNVLNRVRHHRCIGDAQLIASTTKPTSTSTPASGDSRFAWSRGCDDA